MKRNLCVPLVFLMFVFLLVSNMSSARVLLPKFEQGYQKLKAADGTAKDENISNLMGIEEICGNEGEECTPERMLLAEAHLDYIYTQKHSRP